MVTCLWLQAPGCGGESTVPPPAEGTGTAATAAATAVPSPPAGMNGFRRGIRGGNVASELINEASGIVASRTSPGVLWVHNDSGDDPRVFALGTDGSNLGIFPIPRASATDWEDMALHDGYLYLADFGDNEERRPYVTIYRVREPALSPGSTAGARAAIIGVQAFELRYPDRPHDAEALLVDPRTGDLYIISKARSGLTMVYRSPAPVRPGTRTTMEHVHTMEFGTDALPGSYMVTAGDTSPDGSAVLLRTYTHAYLWKREGDEPLWKALTRPPLPVPLEEEPQGEAICFDAVGRGYFTVSEGEHPPLFYFAAMD